MLRLVDILAALDYALQDRYFTVGMEVIERKTGHPMRGSFSEPATCIDLGVSISNLYTKPGIQKSAGLFLEGTDPNKLLAGILHVDDGLLLSRVWCCDCIFRGICRIWPKDVGASPEESGAKVDFLSITISLDLSGYPIISPLIKNLVFARGISQYPAVSRIPEYLALS